MQFGYNIPTTGEPRFVWGARTIYQRGYIDLVPNRQCYGGDYKSDPIFQQFLDWLNFRALPWLRNEVKVLNVGVGDNKELVLHEFKYELRANPNASHGYIYIGAVEHNLVEAGMVKNPATGADERLVQIRDMHFIVDEGIVPVGTAGRCKVNGIGMGQVMGYYNERYASDDMPDRKLACLQVEFYQPEQKWLDQWRRNDAEKEAKAGRLPKVPGLDYTVADDRSREYKAWMRNWNPGPRIIWPNNFVTEGVPQPVRAT